LPSRGKIELSKTGSVLAHSGDHEELHHYTSLEALAGILSTNTLRATSFRYLNDSSEIHHLKEVMTGIVSRRLAQAADELFRDWGPSERAPEHKEGDARLAVAATFVNGLHNMLFDPDSPMKIEPFVTCHGRDSPYEAEHGLLSQWRAYGRDAGVCLVFDWRMLVALLNRESRMHAYHQLALVDVVYNLDEAGVERALEGVFKVFADIAEEILRHDSLPLVEFDRLISTFSEAACRVKHRGFQEEREVRILAVPTDQDDSSFVPPGTAPMPPVHSKPGTGARYIEINGRLADIKTCLRRIIVGPSRNQSAIEAKVRELAPGLPVTSSQIPLV
jgi:hypothetical protein